MLHQGGTAPAADSSTAAPEAASTAAAVRLIGLRKTYGDVVAIERLSLDIQSGEFFTMLGPSGSGKTTTLRLIAGFEAPDSGAIELPGIITGMALNSFFSNRGLTFSLLTIVIGHATFCIVTVYNNVLARLRRTQTSLVEASMDLGADGWQTFRLVILPVIATALVAGGLLAFALSFDEVVVTTFTAGAQNTLPIWIFGNIRLGQALPQVNVVVLFVIVLTTIPVALAQRLTRDTGVLRSTQRSPAVAAAVEGAAA